VQQRLAAQQQQQNGDAAVADAKGSGAGALQESRGTARAKALLAALLEKRQESDQVLASALEHAVARRAQHASERAAQLAEAEKSVACEDAAYQAEEGSLDAVWSQLQDIGLPQELHSSLLAAVERSHSVRGCILMHAYGKMRDGVTTVWVVR
jgi:phosphohistidine phosphatase SixA